MGGLGVKFQHFPLTSLVVLTTLTLPCERDRDTFLPLTVYAYLRSSANFRTVFSENQNANPLDAEAKHILTQNGLSKSSVSVSMKSH